MPPIKGEVRPKPFGHLKLSEKEKIFSNNAEPNNVFVYWDLKHCPPPESYKMNDLMAYINLALSKLDKENILFVKNVTIVGDPSSMTAKQFQVTQIHHKQFKWRHGCDRNPVCNGCKKEYKYKGKEGESADAVFLRELIGHGFDYGRPGYVLLITADFFFNRAMRFLSSRGFRVLLAHNPDSKANFHEFAYYTWEYEDLFKGKCPKYSTEGELVSNFQPIVLERFTEHQMNQGLLNPQPWERNTKVFSLWDIENSPLKAGYALELLIGNINAALSKFNNGRNCLKLSHLTVIGSDASNCLPQGDRKILKSSGMKAECEVFCQTPDQRVRKCEKCQTEYNHPRPQIKRHQDQYSRVMDVADFMITEKIMQHLIDFGAPGVVLLISRDMDFAPTLEFLRLRGFKILVATTKVVEGERRNSLHFGAHLGWDWDFEGVSKGMEEGEGPTWFNEEFP